MKVPESQSNNGSWTDDVSWEYADASEGDKTQWGPRIDAVLAEVYRDFVRVNHGGTFRNKFGPEAETAIRYHLVLYFVQRSWQLERIAAGEAESIRNPDQFISIIQNLIQDVKPELLDAADSISELELSEEEDAQQSATTSREGGDVRLFDNNPEASTSRSQNTDAEETEQVTQEDIAEAVETLEQFMKLAQENLPDETPVEAMSDDEETENHDDTQADDEQTSK